MIISIIIFGTVLIILATFIITVLVSKIDNTISKLSEYIEEFHIKTSLFTQLNTKQLTENVLEELYAFQTNFCDSINEKELSNIFSKKVLEHNTRCALQWAAASLSDRETIRELERQTQERTNSIIGDRTLTAVEKRKQIDEICNTNSIIATRHFEAYRDKIQLTRKEVSYKTKQRRRWYNLFVWLQILGLLILAFGNLLEKLNTDKNETLQVIIDRIGIILGIS